MQLNEKGENFIFKFEHADYSEPGNKKKIELFLFEFKQNVPENKRTYFPLANQWHVNNAYRAYFSDLFQKYFKTTEQKDLFKGGYPNGKTI